MSPHASISVHKFGGAALADGASVRRVADLVASIRCGTLPIAPPRAEPALPERPVIAVSAMAGVTNELLAIAAAAAAGDGGTTGSRLVALRERHAVAWAEACAGATPPATPPAELERIFDRTEAILCAVAGHGSLSPATLDSIVAAGEQLSAIIVVDALRARGIPAAAVDATLLVHTDGRAGSAVPDLTATARAARELLPPLLESGSVAVVPGFIGRAPDGSTVTLGRGGTDLTATTLAAALGLHEVTLWKDVPGFLTADPRVVPDARIITRLHLREAAELAYYGATILHPRALIPLARRGDCIVRIRPFRDPAAPGTIISPEPDSDPHPVRALSAMPHQAIVTVSGNGMPGSTEIPARTFVALEQGGIPVSLISQASSEHSICLGVPAEHAAAARARLEEAFAPELERGEIDCVAVREATATVAVVGLGMAGTPGVAARLCAALAARDINIIAIAQGSAEHNISVVVREDDAACAQRAIHAEFHLGKIGGGRFVNREGEHRADVILLGFGQIGRALAEMLAEREATARTARVVGVVDRGGFVFDPGGFPAERLREMVAAKRGGSSVGSMAGGVCGSPIQAVRHILAHALRRPIVVDLTADETTPLLEYALEHGADLVLANKRPVGGSRSGAESLRAIAAAGGRRILHETTVGAGLPVLDTFYKLIEAGDTVRSIEGCPSGTMGYLFGEMGRGVAFSQALRGAMELGYTEPDPRDDLSGADVARKALILGRLLGFEGELEDVEVESLVPADAAATPLADFLATLEKYDARWEERVAAARSRGAVLRYRATATSRSVTVGLVEVPAASALGALSGTDNQFAFTTARYDTNPLVITGPGAGPAVTAAGVLNDVLELARVS
jgi:aspartokinase/homoserine dehydrogenase 1